MASRFRFLLLCVLASSAAAAAQACGDDGGSYGVVFDDAGPRGDSPDGAGGPRDGEAPLATLRLAHLARELGPIDFCYQAARAGSFEGPIFRTGGAARDAAADGPIFDASLDVDLLDDAEAEIADASDDDAGSKALAFGSVSKYLTLAATGTLVLSIVPAGATSCGGAIATGTVTLDPGKLTTVALFAGAGDAGAAIASFTDDRVTKADKARVRMVHAASGGSFAVHVAGAQTTVVAESVEPRRASSASSAIPVDALGFATIVPVAPPAAFVVIPAADAGDAGEPWQSGASDLDLRGDSLHTGFVVGEPGAFEVLWCADKNTTGDRTTCTMIR